MTELIKRLEAATGPDDALDLALAEWAYENRVPIGFYGRTINYDPRLWVERHGWEPTASIDAALTLVPEGFNWEVGTLVGRPDATVQAATYNEDTYNGVCEWVQAPTPALAICIAALKAKGEMT